MPARGHLLPVVLLEAANLVSGLGNAVVMLAFPWLVLEATGSAAAAGAVAAISALPGLVADGRDMGTVVFPDAALKVFLTADAATRAERRHKQLISKGISANIDSLRLDLQARDERDRSRAVAPLKPAEDAVLFDNSATSIDESVDRVLQWWSARQAH